MSALDDMNSIREPPELSRSVVLMKAEDLSDEKVAPRPWESVQRPVDFVLMTVKECEFLACLSLLKDGLYKSFHKTLGQVYFGTFGEGERRQKIALIICNKGSSGPQGSAILVPKAVKKLRPKAVLNVGYCGGLNKKKVKLGDIVVSSKLITYGAIRVTEEGTEELGHVVPLDSQLANLARSIDHGWKAPLTDSEELKVKIHSDGVMLSGPEVVDSKERNQQLLERFPRAIAIEMEGEGLFAAAHDLKVEWIVIKAVSDFADGTKTSTKSWQQFASVMAASLTAHFLRKPYVFDDWQHYEDDPSEPRRTSPSRSGDSNGTSTVCIESPPAGSNSTPSTCSEPLSPAKKKRKTQDAVKEGIPTNEELENLAGEIADKWKPLGRRLGFDEAQLVGFHKDVDEYRQKAYAMLLGWKQKKGSEATYKILHGALCDDRVQRRDLAEKYCCQE